MNKLSLVGMQLPEKYKGNFDVSSEGPSSGRALIAQNVKILHRLKNIEPQDLVDNVCEKCIALKIWATTSTRARILSRQFP
jgi:hypothetical protein